MNRQGKFTVALLSIGHFVTDSYSSFLLPLLPLLTIRLDLTPAQAGLLIPTMMVTSSLMQPVYGMISDRYLKRAMSVFGPLIAAIFFSAIGLATDLWMLLAFVILGGIGIGAFHPQSAAIVTGASARHRSTTMSIFSSAGTVGIALGPVLITTIVARFGLEKSYYALLPGIITWALLWRYCPPLEVRRDADHPPLRQSLLAVWAPLLLLYLAVVLRSAAHVSIQTYLPFILTGQGRSLTAIGWVLSGFIFFGGIGGLFGGVIADRFGARRVSIVSMAMAGPLLMIALLSSGWLSYALLAVGGTFLNVGVPVNIVMAQRLVPGGASTVSALMMGFAWGAGAMLTPLTGALSESFGFTSALVMASLLVPLGAALMWRLPADQRASERMIAPALAVSD
jgi:FSR family fosmidomycin resistance protein-like MFS transporter